MSTTIDYYYTLGVYPGVKEEIIHLSYQMIRSYLSSIDNDNSAQELNKINQAYLILSNNKTRAEYDSKMAEKLHLVGNYLESKLDTQPENTLFIDGNWSGAVKNHPQLSEIEADLRMISWRLVNAFKLYLLDKKYFDGAKIIASQFEKTYLENFFSSNMHLIDFAKMLIINQETIAARDLNHLVVYKSVASETNETDEQQTAINNILKILDQYSLHSCNFDSLLINAAMRLEPQLVAIYLKAGANPNVLVDGNQSIFTCFTNQYRFMRYKGFEEEIKKKYAIDRSFYKYKAKKIDIIEDRKKRLVKEQQRKEYIKKLLLIILLIILWLIHVNK